MRPNRILALFMAAILLILPGIGGVLSADSAGSVVITMDTVELTLKELEELQYDVPVYVRLLYNSGVSAGKFTVYTEDYPASWFLYGDPDTGGQVLLSDMVWTAAENGSGGIAFTHSSETVSNATGIIARLVVHLDASAMPGDEIHLTFNMPYGADPADYDESDSMWTDASGSPQNICIPVDGVIRILENPPETDAVQLAIDNVRITPQELAAMDYTVPVYVRLMQNPGVSSVQFNLYVDKRCGFSAYTGSDIEDENLVIFGTGYVMDNPDIGAVCFAGASGSLFRRIGALVRLDVRVPETAKPGDVFPIVYGKAPEGIQIAEEEPLWNDHIQNPSVYYSSTAVDGCICIRSGLKGDVNGNGVLELADAVILQRYLLGLNSLPEPELADTMENGTVNVLDLCLLKRWLLTPEGAKDLP